MTLTEERRHVAAAVTVPNNSLISPLLSQKQLMWFKLPVGKS